MSPKYMPKEELPIGTRYKGPGVPYSDTIQCIRCKRNGSTSPPAMARAGWVLWADERRIGLLCPDCAKEEPA